MVNKKKNTKKRSRRVDESRADERRSDARETLREDRLETAEREKQQSIFHRLVGEEVDRVFGRNAGHGVNVRPDDSDPELLYNARLVLVEYLSVQDEFARAVVPAARVSGASRERVLQLKEKIAESWGREIALVELLAAFASLLNDVAKQALPAIAYGPPDTVVVATAPRFERDLHDFRSTYDRRKTDRTPFGI